MRTQNKTATNEQPQGLLQRIRTYCSRFARFLLSCWDRLMGNSEGQEQQDERWIRLVRLPSLSVGHPRTEVPRFGNGFRSNSRVHTIFDRAQHFISTTGSPIVTGSEFVLNLASRIEIPSRPVNSVRRRSPLWTPTRKVQRLSWSGIEIPSEDSDPTAKFETLSSSPSNSRVSGAINPEETSSNNETSGCLVRNPERRTEEAKLAQSESQPSAQRQNRPAQPETTSRCISRVEISGQSEHASPQRISRIDHGTRIAQPVQPENASPIRISQTERKVKAPKPTQPEHISSLSISKTEHRIQGPQPVQLEHTSSRRVSQTEPKLQASRPAHPEHISPQRIPQTVRESQSPRFAKSERELQAPRPAQPEHASHRISRAEHESQAPSATQQLANERNTRRRFSERSEDETLVDINNQEERKESELTRNIAASNQEISRKRTEVRKMQPSPWPKPTTQARKLNVEAEKTALEELNKFMEKKFTETIAEIADNALEKLKPHIESLRKGNERKASSVDQSSQTCEQDLLVDEGTQVAIAVPTNENTTNNTLLAPARATSMQQPQHDTETVDGFKVPSRRRPKRNPQRVHENPPIQSSSQEDEKASLKSQSTKPLEEDSKTEAKPESPKIPSAPLPSQEDSKSSIEAPPEVPAQPAIQEDEKEELSPRTSLAILKYHQERIPGFPDFDCTSREEVKGFTLPPPVRIPSLSSDSPKTPSQQPFRQPISQFLLPEYAYPNLPPSPPQWPQALIGPTINSPFPPFTGHPGTARYFRRPVEYSDNNIDTFTYTNPQFSAEQYQPPQNVAYGPAMPPSPPVSMSYVFVPKPSLAEDVVMKDVQVPVEQPQLSYATNDPPRLPSFIECPLIMPRYMSKTDPPPSALPGGPRSPLYVPPGYTHQNTSTSEPRPIYTPPPPLIPNTSTSVPRPIYTPPPPSSQNTSTSGTYIIYTPPPPLSQSTSASRPRPIYVPPPSPSQNPPMSGSINQSSPQLAHGQVSQSSSPGAFTLGQSSKPEEEDLFCTESRRSKEEARRQAKIVKEVLNESARKHHPG